MKTDFEKNALIKEALLAREFSYSPYSKFRVGAALLAGSGKIYKGCNIENAAYSPTNCAERTAFFKAVSEGERKFTAIAIAGDTNDYLYPCGVCRQVMSEFCSLDSFVVICVKNEQSYRTFTLKDLLPNSFSQQDFTKAKETELNF